MGARYSISEVASFFNISNQTLHYYDRIGLYKPSYVDPQTRYRYYDQEQFNKMFMIQFLKEIGLSLEEIAEMQRNQNLDALKVILERNLAELEDKIRELNSLKANMETYMDMIDLSKRPRRKQDFELRRIPARHVFYIHVAFSLEDLSQYVEMIYKAYVKASRLHLPISSNSRMLLTMNRDAIEAGKYKYYSGIGLIIPKPAEHGNVIEIKESLYATGIHVGKYGTLPNTYKRLHAFIREEGYRVDGFATEVSLANMVQTSNPEEYITEIQIPVCRADD